MLRVESEGALGFGIPEDQHMISQHLTDNSINPALAEAPNDRAGVGRYCGASVPATSDFVMIIDAWMQHPNAD
jgi:hypothetical protein